MSIVANKYTPSEMPPEELEATFAAREHTVDYLLKSLRGQVHKQTLSSHVITGPRGAGKSTIIQMIALRIRQDPELNAAWIPVVFPEEQFEITNLRDMLASILRELAKKQIPQAQDWLEKVEAEPNEEQSQQLAITGLKEIARQTHKRFILFIENLDQLLGRNLDDQMKGTLRRLLMTDPVMMIIGSTVHIFDSLKDYDEAFFNYFDQVPLHRLNAEQISELLKKRAQFDGNETFLHNLPAQQAKIKTLVHLTGGNPRLALLLYELLSSQKITTVVQYLRKLVDELTPLLKHEMENLPPQQQKIIDALMRKGGTAQPADLVGFTRLPLNAITTQLKRLKEIQIVEVLGGGKGRAAHYTVPDKLFSIWYQMRYLSQNRRRIEMFVEVLRIWFEEEERVQALQVLAQQANNGAPQVLRECAVAGEYYAASLKGTKHESFARDLCISNWLKADLREAAAAHADFAEIKISVLGRDADEEIAFAEWCQFHNEPQKAIEICNQILAKSEGINTFTRANVLLVEAPSKGLIGDTDGAIADASAVLSSKDVPADLMALAYYTRGFGKRIKEDWPGAIADFTACLNIQGAPKGLQVDALQRLGLLRSELRDYETAIKDLNAAMALDESSSPQILETLIAVALNKSDSGDFFGAIQDLTKVLERPVIPKECKERAMINRAAAKSSLRDAAGAMMDYSAVLEIKDVSSEGVARALIGRAGLKLSMSELQGAFDDFSRAIAVNNAPQDQIAKAITGRGICYSLRGDLPAALTDLISVVTGPFENTQFRADAARLAFYLLWDENKQAEALNIIGKLSSKLNSTTIPLKDAIDAAFRLLISLAQIQMKSAWPAILNELTKGLKSEIAEALKFFEPVARVLEGKDRGILDALPPEQREFALSVLAKFESKESKQS